MENLLIGHSYSFHQKPNKLIVMLHGYGDNAENFLHLANSIDILDWKAHYLSLSAPSLIPNYPNGNQWFDLYPNNIYIEEAGPTEIQIIKKEVEDVIVRIEKTIKYHLNNLGLHFNNCMVLGFSQGGMITYELGNFCNESLGALGILSGRIMEKKTINNLALKKTPIFISHGDQDDVISIKNFYESCTFLKENKCNFESHELYGDTHTISANAILLLQKFIKKNL